MNSINNNHAAKIGTFPVDPADKSSENKISVISEKLLFSDQKRASQSFESSSSTNLTDGFSWEEASEETADPFQQEAINFYNKNSADVSNIAKQYVKEEMDFEGNTNKFCSMSAFEQRSKELKRKNKDFHNYCKKVRKEEEKKEKVERKSAISYEEIAKHLSHMKENPKNPIVRQGSKIFKRFSNK